MLHNRVQGGTRDPGFNGAGMFPSQKCDVAIELDDAQRASMGPGCFHPRNEKPAVILQGHYQLQWGRDVSIPEIRLIERRRRAKNSLQWGRDVSIPEIAIPLW